MNNNISPELIRKYLNGRCSPAEINQVQDWYQSFEANQDPLVELDESERLVLRGLMLKQIRNNIQKTHQQQSSRQMKPLLYAWIGSAAAILVVLVWLTYYKTEKSKEMEIEMTTANRDMVIKNLTKTIHKHVLADGSEIWLRPGAQLTYTKDFGRNHRTVRMTGEAFFEIVKDPKHPFVIYSGEVITKVWGTSFRISDHKGVTEIAVLTGKVSVTSQEVRGQSLMLQPNQKAVFFAASKAFRRETFENDTTILMWKKTDLFFDNTPLEDIVRTLNNQFGVNIRIADAALNTTVLSADFNEQSLPQVLEIIEKSLNVEYSINQQDIVIYKPRM
jgi:transmembrane sensor